MTLVALVETAMAVFEVEAEKPSSAEPPMATGAAAGLLCVKYQPTPMPAPMAINSITPKNQTHVERRVEPLSVFLSQALAQNRHERHRNGTWTKKNQPFLGSSLGLLSGNHGESPPKIVSFSTNASRQESLL